MCPKGSGKLIDTMANVSIFSGNFFHFVKSKKYAFQMMSTNFKGKISVVTITTETRWRWRSTDQRASNLHLRQTLRRPKNHGCLGCATQNLPPQYRGVCMIFCSMSLEKDQSLCHTLHMHVSVCVTHYTGPTILAYNYTLTLSWPSVIPGPWYPSQAALWVSLALGTSPDSSLGL